MQRILRTTLAATAFVLAATGVAGAQAAGSDISAAISHIRYALTFDSATAARHTVQVAMTFEVAGAEPVLLSLPAWAPGHYDIMGFARRASHFAAAMDGQALRWDRADYDTWRVRPTGRGTVTVRFDFLADTLQTASAWSQPDFLMVNGTNVFLYPQGRSLDFAATVTVNTRPDWTIVTGMHQAAAPRTYDEATYHDLTDMPFFIGRFDVDSAPISGKWTRLASYPAGRLAGAARAALWQAMQKFVPAETAVFGVTPWDDYTVFMILPEGFGGGTALEHQSSNVGIYAPALAGSPVVSNVVAHEMFHAFNVKRVRPADMFPYRYEGPQPTPLLWVSEGFADYYADLAEVRGGAIDSLAFAQNTLGHLDAVADAPPASVEDASLSVWIHPTDGTDFLYYDKGSVLGLLLDILIRDASENRGSLDQVMRELYQRNWLRGRGFTNDEFWAAASRAAGGRSFASFYDRYVDGRDSLPLDSVLPLAGMRRTAHAWRAPRLAINTFGDSTGARVTGVVPGGCYAAAGGQVGDTILALGGVDVRRDVNFDEFRRRWAGHEGETFTIEIRRAGQAMTLSARVVLVDRVDTSLDYLPDASAKALRIRAGLLHGGR